MVALIHNMPMCEHVVVDYAQGGHGNLLRRRGLLSEEGFLHGVGDAFVKAFYLSLNVAPTKSEVSFNIYGKGVIQLKRGCATNGNVIPVRSQYGDFDVRNVNEYTHMGTSFDPF